jgi:hypothetical protein
MLTAAVSFLFSGTAPGQSVTFDFDTATPALVVYQGTPLSQTSGGVTANFSSPQEQPATPAFSVEDDAHAGLTLTRFSGKYLYPNRNTADSLTLQFTTPVTNISLVFATTDHPPIEIPNSIRLSAFQNSTPVGTPVTAPATYHPGIDSLPMGSIAFNSGGTQFNIVKLALVLPGDTPTGFLVDNITVEYFAPPAAPELALFLTSTNAVVISWPAASPGFGPQQNTELGTASWVDITNPVSFVGDQAQVVVTPLTTNCFFRLSHP